MALLPTDPALSLGLIVAFSFWLAGFGPYLWLQKLFQQTSWPSWAASLLAGLALQTGPVMLRGLPTAYLAALGLGALGLGLADARLAWIAGLWSWPNACFFAVLGILQRKPFYLLAGLPLIAVLLAPSDLPGALRHTLPSTPSSPGYLAGEGTLFPMPPAEVPSVKEEDKARPWIGMLLVPLQRIHGGPLALLGLLAALWGIILGFPVLRLRGDYLAIVTLAAAVILEQLVRSSYPLGADNGITSVPALIS